MNTRVHNPEVLFAVDEVRGFDDLDLAELAARARANPSGVCRICLHRNEADPVHEMLIAKRRDSVYPPHCHRATEESLIVIQGLAELLLFDGSGLVTRRLPLGGPGSGRTAFARIPALCYHDLRLESEMFIFLETKPGPFNPSDNQTAPFKAPF